MGEFSLVHILVVLVVVLIFFGPQKLASLGGDLGKGIRAFKAGISNADEPPPRKKKRQRALTASAAPPALDDGALHLEETEEQESHA
ncbi:MAG: twin-arginine translocase TatA/TatE family subunit [Sorangiineae bacterium]|nr:twin-arginine translocase TatA/TatE family subunit [Polyangiaceae bacterium]MEB2322592.1 twin-arginine translocase TatA/TatE family subunit [Sorangiineae bacterium]